MTESQGLSGERGRDGAVGAAGAVGAEGRVGDPGTPGIAGTAGAAGAAGAEGASGAIGKQGDRGPSSTSRLLVMFIIMMSVFMLLGIRSEINSNRISESANEARVVARETQKNAAEIESLRLQSAITNCEEGVEILKRFNRFLRRSAEIEQKGIDSGELPEATSTRLDRIRNFEATLVKIPDCDALPRP